MKQKNTETVYNLNKTSEGGSVSAQLLAPELEQRADLKTKKVKRRGYLMAGMLTDCLRE